MAVDSSGRYNCDRTTIGQANSHDSELSRYRLRFERSEYTRAGVSRAQFIPAILLCNIILFCRESYGALTTCLRRSMRVEIQPGASLRLDTANHVGALLQWPVT